MSAAAHTIDGPGRMVGLKPANTSEADILTAGDERPVVVGIVIANNTGSAATATLRWNDGTTSYDILAAKSVAANDTLFVDQIFLPLRSGYKIKVTSGTGNALTFTLVVVERVGRAVPV